MQNREFKLQPSRQYILLILLLISSTLILFLFLPLTPGIKLIGSVILLAYGWQLWRKTGLLSSIHCMEDGAFHLLTSDQRMEAQLMGDSTVTNFISILRFRVLNKRLPYSCLIFPDSLQEGQYRQLLVILQMR